MTFHDSLTDISDPEVVPKAKRRQFSAQYKVRILEEADVCTEAGQVQRIEEEVRRGQASPDELRLLSLVAVASAYGARLRTRDVIATLELPAPNRTMEQFEQEYLLRRTTGGMYLEGLHPIRSNILSRLLIQPDVNPRLDIIAQALPLMLEEDLETFMLHALVDEDHDADCDGFLDLVKRLQPRTWSGIAGVLRSLLWVGAQEYVTVNRAMLDAAYQELGPAWWFAVDLNFASPGEGPELGEWWTTLGSLIPPERQARIKTIREGQTPKDVLFQRPREWLHSLSTSPESPSMPEIWRDVAEAWYWAGRLVPDKSLVDWVPEDEFDALAEDLPLTILADLSFSLHLYAPERHRGWLEAHEGILHQRLAYQQDILALESAVKVKSRFESKNEP